MHEWKKVAISEFLFEREGKFKPTEAEVANLERIEKIDFSGKVHISRKSSNTNMIIIKPGDFVISGINVSKGAMAIYEGANDVCATIHYSSYTFDRKVINVEYFKRFLRSKLFIDLLKKEIKGGIKTEIKPKHLLPLTIKLPPLEIQNEIVEKFLKFEGEISQLLLEVQSQKGLIEKLRKTMLQDAIAGNLTKDWRGGQSCITPASDLLDEIYARNNARPTKIAVDEPSFDLPPSWRWARLGDLIDENRGITYGIVKMGGKPKSGGVKALRCSDVKYRYVDTSNCRSVYEEGGCAIADNKLRNFNIAREIAIIPLANQNMNDFILDVLTSSYFEKEIQKNLRGIAYKGLNLNILRTLLVPVPPQEEQEQITLQVRSLLKLIDELGNHASDSADMVQALKQTALDEAFL